MHGIFCSSPSTEGKSSRNIYGICSTLSRNDGSDEVESRYKSLLAFNIPYRLTCPQFDPFIQLALSIIIAYSLPPFNSPALLNVNYSTWPLRNSRHATCIDYPKLIVSTYELLLSSLHALLNIQYINLAYHIAHHVSP